MYNLLQSEAIIFQGQFYWIYLQYAAVPGHTLLPDFFLDEYDEFIAQISHQKKKSASASIGGAAKEGGKVQAVFDKLSKHLSEELVGQAQAVYLFNVTGAGRFNKRALCFQMGILTALRRNRPDAETICTNPFCSFQRKLGRLCISFYDWKLSAKLVWLWIFLSLPDFLVTFLTPLCLRESHKIVFVRQWRHCVSICCLGKIMCLPFLLFLCLMFFSFLDLCLSITILFSGTYHALF